MQQCQNCGLMIRKTETSLSSASGLKQNKQKKNNLQEEQPHAQLPVSVYRTSSQSHLENLQKFNPIIDLSGCILSAWPMGHVCGGIIC